jgi:uncharacterized protein YndB with AHSA1/START domain
MLENKPTTTADGTFVITRVFSAPRQLVWAAWSDAEQTRLGACRQPGAEQTAAPAQDHLTV